MNACLLSPAFGFRSLAQKNRAPAVSASSGSAAAAACCQPKLLEAGKHEAVEHCADIAGGGQTQHQTLHLGRVVAAGHGQCHRKARAAHAKEHAQHQQQGVGGRARHQQQHKGGNG